MLSYAFQVLEQNNYEYIAKEDFENVESLFAEILRLGVTKLLKQGLYHEYVMSLEELNTMRGKINMPDTIRYKSQHRNLLSCEVDDYTVNNIYNQIIKSTLLYLLAHENVKKEQKIKIKRIIPYLSNVDVIDFKTIHWTNLRYHRNNQTYMMLLSICKFIIQKQLLTTDSGANHLLTYSENNYMYRLFERFVRVYYQKHYPEFNADSEKIKWDITENSNGIEMLPEMLSDITLHYKNRLFIIDTKYYSKIFQSQYNKKTFHSNNLYQLFAYVINKAQENSSLDVEGMLLYAQTTDEIVPKNEMIICGHKMKVATLNLNTPFNGIKQQLDDYAAEFIKM